jgi:hypothetical protein
MRKRLRRSSLKPATMRLRSLTLMLHHFGKSLVLTLRYL